MVDPSLQSLLLTQALQEQFQVASQEPRFLAQVCHGRVSVDLEAGTESYAGEHGRIGELESCRPRL